MKRLLPFLLLLALAGLVFWIFGNTNASPEPSKIPAAPTQVENIQAATLDASPERLLEKAPATFNPRIEKMGAGHFGLQGTVVDEKGVPLADMWVGAFPSPYPLFDYKMEVSEIFEHPLQFNLEPIASSRTDADGHFQLQGLAGRGTYLVARGQHHLTRGRQEVRPTDLDNNTSGKSEGNTGITVHTIPGAALQGTVQDEFGAPVANAEVFVGPSLLYLIQAIRNRDIYLERVFTDHSGHYSIDVVPANQKLMVLALDGATHPGLRDFGPLQANTDASVQLQLAATGSLRGQVVDSDDQGVSAAKVLAIPLDLRLLVGVVRALPEYIVKSDAKGRFHFPQLPKRNVVLIAQARNGRAAPVTCAVTGADSTVGKKLVLQTVRDIQGRVVDVHGKGVPNAKIILNSIPLNSDSAKKSNRIPSADTMLLEAAGELLPEFLPIETWTLTDAGGRFHLPAWEGAKLKVEAESYSKSIYTLPKEAAKERFALILLQPGSVAGRVIETSSGKPLQFFVVSASQQGTMLEPKIEVAQKEKENSTAYYERKKTLEAEARAAALGNILPPDEEPVLPQISKMDSLRSVQFHEDGSAFRIDGLLPGTWKIEARADGYVLASQANVLVEPSGVTEGVDLQMSRGATLQGRVVAFGSREAIAGAVITIGRSKESGFEAYFRMGVETTAMARSAADGSFTLHGIEAGMEWVHVMAEGFSPTSIQGKPLEEGEIRSDVVIQVRQGANIHGHVYDRHGTPIPARLVGGFSTDSQDFWQAATDEDGYYHADHIKPGSYFILTASLDDEALFTGNFMGVLNGSKITQAYVKEGQNLELDIEDLSAGGCHLRGKLLSQGAPIRHANLFAMATDTGGLFDLRMATAVTDEQGEFDFKSLAPGDYRLQVSSETWEGAIAFEAPELLEDYQVLETPNGVVRGRVLTEQAGSPVEGASIKLIHDNAGGGLFAMFSGGKETDWSSSDNDGYFEFEGKSAGRYHIEVEINAWEKAGNPLAGEGVLGKAQSKGFTLYENDTKTIADILLPISSAIRVQVQDSRGKAPSQGYSLTAVQEGVAKDAKSFSNWGFGGEGLISGVDPGTYTVRIEGRDFATAQVNHVIVGEAETVEVQIHVEKGVSLSARILGANGQSLPGATIKVFDADGNRVDGLNGPTAVFSQMFGGENGAMPLGSFVPGSYSVEVEYQDQVQTQNASLQPTQALILEFQFR